MAGATFWDDTQGAQKIIGEANAIRAKLDPLADHEQKIADLKTLKELVLEDASDAAAKEFQGPKGPEPTRYGDWENKGIASDF